MDKFARVFFSLVLAISLMPTQGFAAAVSSASETTPSTQSSMVENIASASADAIANQLGANASQSSSDAAQSAAQAQEGALASDEVPSDQSAHAQGSQGQGTQDQQSGVNGASGANGAAGAGAADTTGTSGGSTAEAAGETPQSIDATQATPAQDAASTDNTAASQGSTPEAVDMGAAQDAGGAQDGPTIETDLVEAVPAQDDQAADGGNTEAPEIHPLALASGEDVPAWAARIAAEPGAVELPTTLEGVLAYYKEHDTEGISTKLSVAHGEDGAFRIPQPAEIATMNFSADSYAEAVQAIDFPIYIVDTPAGEAVAADESGNPVEGDTEAPAEEQELLTFAKATEGANRAAVVEAVFTPAPIDEAGLIEGTDSAAPATNAEAALLKIDAMSAEELKSLEHKVAETAAHAQHTVRAAFGTEVVLDPILALDWLAIQHAADSTQVPHVLLAVWDGTAHEQGAPVLRIATPVTDEALLSYIYVGAFANKAARAEIERDYYTLPAPPAEDAGAEAGEPTEGDASDSEQPAESEGEQGGEPAEGEGTEQGAEPGAEGEQGVAPEGEGSEESSQPEADITEGDDNSAVDPEAAVSAEVGPEAPEPVSSAQGEGAAQDNLENVVSQPVAQLLKSNTLVSVVKMKAKATLTLGSGNTNFTKAAPASYQADGSQVETFKLSWVTPDSDNRNNSDSALYINPANTSDAKLYLTAQLDYALSGEHDYAPGDIVITVPTTMIVNRDGSQGDAMVIPFPQAPSTSKDFNWTLGTDDNGNPAYVLTNTRPMSAATKGFIQFGFKDITPHLVRDMSTSKPFSAVIEVTTHAGNVIGRSAGPLTAQIDTSQTATSASKHPSEGETLQLQRVLMSKADFVRIYGENTGVADVGDDGNYIVLLWPVRLYHVGNQPFTLSITDELSGIDAGQYGGRVVRMDVGNAATSGSGTSLTITPYTEPNGTWQENGSVYCLVHTAYPLTTAHFPYNNKNMDTSALYYDQDSARGYYHRLRNNVTLTLAELDNPNNKKTLTATAQTRFHWEQPTWVEPQGHFNLFKWGNDGAAPTLETSKSAYSTNRLAEDGTDMNERLTLNHFYNGYPMNNYGIYPEALNKLSGINAGTDPEDVDIAYTIESDAYILPWTYKAGYNPFEGSGTASNPQFYTMGNFGRTPVTTVVTDKGLTMNGTALTPLDDYTFKNLYIPVPVVGYAQAKNLNPAGGVIATSVDDGTFEYFQAKNYSDIKNLENDGTPVMVDDGQGGKVVQELGAAEPIYVDIEVKNPDGTTSWINNYASLDYTEYVSMKRTDPNYSNNVLGRLTYYYNPDGTPIANPQPEAGKTSDVGNLPANMVNFRTHVTTNKAYYHYYVLPTVTLKASHTQTVETTVPVEGGEEGETTTVTATESVSTKPTEIALAAFGSREAGNRNVSPELNVQNDVSKKAYVGTHYPGDGSGISAGGPVFNKEIDGVDKLRGYLTDVLAVPSKTGEFLRQDTTNVYMHYSAKMEFQTYITDLATYQAEAAKNGIPQVQAGVWYDLLPAGMAPVLSSVKLRDGDSITSVYTVPNYNQSGRTLLVVRANLTPTPEKYLPTGSSKGFYEDVPTLDFDAIYDVGAVKDHGTNPHNVVAFQATKVSDGALNYLGTIEGFEGEYDTPGTQANPAMQNKVTFEDPETFDSDTERRALTDLDRDGFTGEGNEDPLFLYAGTYTSFDAVVAAQASLSKSVSTNGDGIWSTGKDPGDVRMVYEDGYYSYRLRVVSSEDTSTTGIVIYDTLESFIPGQFGTNETDPDENIHTPQWHGELTGVNVDQIKAAGDPTEVDVKVYYSTLKAGQTPDMDDSVTTPANTATGVTQATVTGSQIANGYQLTQGEQAGVWTDPGPAPTLAKYTSGDALAIQDRYTLFDGSGNIRSMWMTEEQLLASGKTLADVTMVAIDARKDKAGNDFVLEPGKSLVAYLYMHAPNETDAEGDRDARYYIENNAHAFNNVYLLSTSNSESAEGGSGSSTTNVRFDYTKVGLKEMQVPVQKVWDDGNNRDGFRSEYVTMHLWQIDPLTGQSTNLINGSERVIRVYEDGYTVVNAQGESEKITTYFDAENGNAVTSLDPWSGVFTGIPSTTPDGLPYAYYVTEDTVAYDNTGTYPDEGDSGEYTLSMGANGEGGYSATNTHKPIRTRIEGEKTWLGDAQEELEAIYGEGTSRTTEVVRPRYIDVELLKSTNGSKPVKVTSKRVRPNLEGTWNYAFEDLYKYENGYLIDYTLVEKALYDTYIPYKYDTEADLEWMEDLSSQQVASAIYHGYYLDEQGNKVAIPPSKPNGSNIINVYHPFGDVVLSKQVANSTAAADGKTFTFVVEFEQAEGSDHPFDGTVAYEVFEMVDENDGNDPQPHVIAGRSGTVASGGTITLEDGQFVRFFDLPEGTHYRFTEQEVAGFTTTGSVVKEGDVVLNQQPMPFANTANSVAYTNTYRATGTTEFGANKQLEGRLQQRLYQFRFNLNQLSWEAQGAEGAQSYVVSDANPTFLRSASTGTATADPGSSLLHTSSATFNGITYSTDTVAADVAASRAWHEVVGGKDVWHYAYQISENIPAGADANSKLDGYTYSTAKLRVLVTVTDNGDGTMSTTKAYQRFDADANGGEGAWVDTTEDAAEAIFKNTYEAEGEWIPKAWKSLPGRALEDGQFTFELLDANKAPVLDGSSNPITATNTANGAVVFAKQSYTLAQLEADKNVGKCAFSQVENAETGIATNYWTYYYFVRERIPDTATATIGGTEYTYADAKAALAAGSLTQAQITAAEWVKDNIVYDTSTFGYSVRIADRGNGTLAVAESYVDEAKASTTDAPVFVNELAPGELQVSKSVQNSEGAPDQEFKFRVRLTGDANKIAELSKSPLPWAVNDVSTQAGGNGSATGEGASGGDTSGGDTSGGSSESESGPSGQPAYTFYFENHNGDAKDYVAHTDTTKPVAIDIYADGNMVVRPNSSSTPVSLGRFSYASILGEIKSAINDNNAYEAIFKSGNIKLSFAPGLQKTSGLLYFGVSSGAGPTNPLYINAQTLKTLDLSNLSVSGAVRFADMFAANCRKLTTVNFGDNFDTSQVTDMSNMFYYCSSLTSLDLSSFNTSSVTKMSNMFYLCSSLTSLDLSSFDTSNVTNMSDMFYQCSKLTSLDLSSLNTTNVTDMYRMFRYCTNLSKVVFGNSFALKTSGTSTPELPNKYKWKRTQPVAEGEALLVKTDTELYAMSNNNESIAGTWEWTDDYNIVYHDSIEPDAQTYTESSSLRAAYTLAQTPSAWQANNKELVGWNLLFASKDSSAISYRMVESSDTPPGNARTVSSYLTTSTSFENYSLSADYFNVKAGAINISTPEYHDIVQGNTIYRFLKLVPGETTIAAQAFNDAFLRGSNDGPNLHLYAIWKDRVVEIVDGEFEFTLRAGQQATFDGIPAGLAYQVWEETPAGWQLVQQSGTSGTISPDAPSVASFTNEYVPDKTFVQFTGTKTIDSQLPAANAFSFQLQPVSTTAAGLSRANMPMPEGTGAAGAGAARTYTVANSAGGFIQFPEINFQEVGTYTYQITEYVPAQGETGYDATIAYDTAVWTATVTVADNGDGTKSATTTYSKGAGNQTSFAFANKTQPASLLLGKQVTSGSTTATNANDTFSFKIRFLNENGVPVDSGTSFDWYYADENGKPIVPEHDPDPGTGEVIPSTTSQATCTVSNGVLTLTPSETGTLGVIDPAGIQSAIAAVGKSSIREVRVADGAYVKISAASGGTSLRELFRDCTNLTSFDGAGFVMSDVTSMNRMFYGCTNLVNITNVDNWDTSSLTDTNRMFWGCSALESLDLSGWDVSQVTDMDQMFNSCNKLAELNIAGWSTDSLSKSQYMFGSSTSLLSKVTIGDGLKLKSDANLNNNGGGWRRVADGASSSDSSFVTTGGNGGTWVWSSNYTSAALIRVPLFRDAGSAMLDALGGFAGAAQGVLGGALDVLLGVEQAYAAEVVASGTCPADTSSAGRTPATWELDSDGVLTFRGTSATQLGYINNGSVSDNRVTTLLGSNVSKVKHIRFENCAASGSMQVMFSSLGNLETIDFTGLDVSSVTNMNWLLDKCKRLTSVTIPSGFDSSRVTSMWELFSGCSALQALDLRNLDTTNVTTMQSMFNGCSSLRTLDLRNLDTTNVTTMTSMFNGCSSLQTLDVSNFNTSRVTGMANMFSGCSSLQTLDVSNFNTSRVTDMEGMFKGCGALSSLDVSSFDTSQVKTMSWMFAECIKLARLTVGSNFTAQRVNNAQRMFSQCHSLTSLDLSSFACSSPSVLTNASFMFDDCYRLETLDISKLDLSAVTNMGEMFDCCYHLSSVKLGPSFIAASGSNPIFPEPSSHLDSRYNSSKPLSGLWKNVDTGVIADLRLGAGLNAVAASSRPGTWVWDVAADSTILMFDPMGGSIQIALPSQFSRYLYPVPSTASITNTVKPQGYAFMSEGSSGFRSATLPTPERAGYAFVGWNTAADGSGTDYQAGDTYKPATADAGTLKTLYAQWLSEDQAAVIVAKHYVQKGDGGYDYANPTLTKTYYRAPGASYAPPVDPNGAWAANYTLPEAQTVVTSGSKIGPNNPYVVSYYYDLKPYTVAYSANGGSGTMASDSVNYGASYAVAANGFTKSGSVFTGWNTKADGSGTSYAPGSRVKNLAQPGKSVTLYAQWIENPNVGPTSGSGEITVRLKAGQRIIFPNLPAGTSYEIVETSLPEGWSFNSATGEVVAGGTVTGTASANDSDSALFTNSYTAAGSATVAAHKKLVGATPTEGQFEFTITDPTKAAGSEGATQTAGNQELDSSNIWLDPNTGNQLFKVANAISDDDVQLAVGDLVYSTGKERYFDDSGNAVDDANDAVTTKYVYIGANGAEYLLTSEQQAHLAAYNPFADTALVQFPSMDFTLAGVLADTAAGKATALYKQPAATAGEGGQGTSGSAGSGSGSAAGDALVVDGSDTYVAWTSALADYPSAWLYWTTLSEFIPQNTGAITYDNSTKKVGILVIDAGKGRLETKVLYKVDTDAQGNPVKATNDGSEATQGVTFTNEMKHTSLLVEKTLERATPAAEAKGRFTFVITLADSAGNPVSGTYNAYVANKLTVAAAAGEEGVLITEDMLSRTSDMQPYGGNGKIVFTNGVGTVTLAGGERVQIDGLPYGVTYTVTETNAGAGFTQSGATNTDGTLDAGTESAPLASIQNTYDAAGEAPIQVTKTLHSAKAIEEGQFTFALLDSNMQVLERATNGAPTEGTITSTQSSVPVNFGNIRITLADLVDGTGAPQTSITRTFYVAEINDGQENITYDDVRYKVEITFTDDGEGHLDPVVKYFDAQGNELNKGTNFVNKFTLNMPATGMAGLSLTGLLLAGLIVSTTLVMRRRRKAYQAAKAARVDAAFDPKSQILQAKEVEHA